MTRLSKVSTAIIQPFVPNYREDFFKGVNDIKPLDVFIYAQSTGKDTGFLLSTFKVIELKNFIFKRFLFYNLFPLLKPKYKTLILMLDFSHISTWILLLTKFIHRKKIILWGQGISVKRYIKEEASPNPLLKLMIKLSDTLWVYTNKEKDIWTSIFPQKKIISLNNTISNLDNILSTRRDVQKVNELKIKYGITERTCLIFCARFDSPYRRVDLLEAVIQNLDSTRFGFIIIGQGINKPDFSKYSNVYDFGAIYDYNKKSELFMIADLYFQPGWVGLSIVEAMAYGKPILTFKRTPQTLQCVEYAYIYGGGNGMIFSDLDSCIKAIEGLTEEEITRMGINAKKFVETQLPMTNMINNAVQFI